MAQNKTGKIVAAIKAGEKYVWIANEYGCSVRTVQNIAAKNELKRGKGNHHQNHAKIDELLRYGVPGKEIIRRLNTCYGTVNNRRKAIFGLCQR